ncbi:hypothetical protein BH09PAT4_BH09PAT4_03460 [soil metagenome]
MNYYEVWVRSHRYQNNSALTYSSDLLLQPGAIVRVPLQQESVLGIVYRQTSRPRFACKPIAQVMELPLLPAASLKLFRWLQAYYPTPVGPLAQLFLPGQVTGTYHDLATTVRKPRPINLNSEQAAALTRISTSGTYLLHGRTGSGKTRLYAALAQQQFDKGRSVLILSPEISLTPQLVQNLEELLAQKAVVLHSRLTTKQRAEVWTQLLTSKSPQLVIGPRSALFAPLNNVGLIVLDEAHEPAYKQEQQPYYYTPRVAAKLAQLQDAILVMGSATPPISEYYLAQQKKRPILELTTLANGQETSVEKIIIDIKDRGKFTQKSPHLSDPLIQAIRLALQKGEQSMLYLNRRGTARLSLCQNCGWQAMCPHCDIPMTYHGDSHSLLCHTCGIRESSHTSCPDCGHADIVLRAAGTKAIADEVTRLFPEARIQRFDTDNLKADRFEQHYASVQQGNVDILVGTQLLAKGLDLPKLSTLGIVLADSSLSIPDYTAQERTYQLVQQVLGRIGRGHTSHATAIIQTYNPDNATLQAALNGDWQTFYDHELAERRQFSFPPFCHLLKLVCRRKSSNAAEKACVALMNELANTFGTATTIDGPTPAFHEKSAGFYQWQLVIKASKRSVLLDVIASLPKGSWSYDIDPINLL